MKRSLTLFAQHAASLVLPLAIAGHVRGQIAVTVSGTAVTSPPLAASYSSLASALTAVNAITSYTTDGTIILTCNSGDSETAPDSKGFTLGSATLNPLLSATNTITINKSGAGAVTLNASGGGTGTPGSASPDGIFKLVGADYVTIDGLTFTDGNTTNPATMEFGVALFKRTAGDGAHDNTIQNCTFNMQRVNNAGGTLPMVDGSVGILVINSTPTAATTALTPTNGGTSATNGTNSNNKFYGNTINGGNIGIALSGFAATSGVGPSPAPTTFLGDLNNDIGGSSAAQGNTVLNYGGGGATSPAAGIRANHQWSVNISYNTINNNNGAGVNHPTTLRGIFAQAGTSANATITNNTVTVRSGATTSALTAIENGIGATAAGNTVSITHNTVTGCTYSTATSGAFTGIVNTASAATVNLNNNQLTSNATNATSGTTNLLQNTGAVTTAINMNDNTVNGWTYNAATTSGTLNCITNTGGTATASLSVQNNNIQAITHAVAGVSAHNYINNTAATLNTTLSNNTFTNLSVATSGSVTFISNNVTRPASAVVNVNNNSVVTAFNKTVAGGTVLLYISNGLTPSSGSETNTGNNFSNITFSGATTFNGWQSTDGSTSAPYGPTKNVSNNTFSNISGGTSGITVLNVGYSRSTGTNTVSGNTITGITGSGNITAMQLTQGPHDVTGNTIRGITSSGTAAAVTGILQSALGAGTMNIAGNLIGDMQSGGTTSGSLRGIDIVAGSSGTTTNVVNNRIGDLRMPACDQTATVLHGIHANASTAGYNINLSYNTVYLNASSSGTNFTTAAVFCNTAPTLTMRNNILVNLSTPAGAGNRTIVYRQAAAGLTNYGSASNHNLFFAGPPDPTRVIHWNGTTAYETLADWKALASPRDANSITENPPFLSTAPSSPNFLKLDPTVATQVESGGIAITGINTDFEADIRQGSGGYTGTGTAPDVGADEFEGIPLDLTPPTISYTALGNTCSTGDRTLSATITDASGVPTSGTGLPRLRWRINTGPWTYVTGVHISGSTYQFTFGSGVTSGDVVQYYVVAQDNAPTPNVGAFPPGGAGGFSSDPPAASTPPTTPSSYTITLLNGTYTVGSGGSFPTLTAAVNFYNISCLAGPVVFELTDASYTTGTGETFPITIGYNADASSTNTLTIRPAASTSPTISGSSTPAILLLNGADFIRIEGSNAPIANGLCQTNSTRNLTIQNTSTSTASAVVWLQSNLSPLLGATNNIVRNCIVTGSGSFNTLAGIGSGSPTISTSTLGTDNDNNVFENNQVSNCQIGIFSVGASAANKNEGTAIRYNTLSTHGHAGVLVRFEHGIGIIGNSVNNVTRSGSLDVAGISAGFAVGDYSSTVSGNGEVTNATITHNAIGTVTHTGTWSSVGIAYGEASTGTTLIANNTISGVSGTATSPDIIVGLLVGGGAGTLNVYHNTVRMQGTNTGSMVSAAFASTGATTHPLNLRNNVLVNTQTGGTHRYNAIATRFATPLTGVVSNNNVLHVSSESPPTRATGQTGGLTGGTTYTFAGWQALPQDAASTNVLPVFISATDLHLSPTATVNAALVDAGANMGVAQDIDCDERAATPTIGADEFRAVYYSQATGDVNTNIWDVVPVGSPGPAIWGTGSSMVVQSGHSVTNTTDVNLRNLTVQTGGTLTLNSATTMNAYGPSVSLAGSLADATDSRLWLRSATAPVALSAGGQVFNGMLRVQTPGGTTVSGSLDFLGALSLWNGNFDASAATVRLASNASATGRLDSLLTGASYTGNLTVERYIPTGATNWRLLGSGVNGQTLNNWKDDFITAGFPGSHYPTFDNPTGSGILWPSIRYYDETNTGPNPLDGLLGAENITVPLTAGKGWAVWCGQFLNWTSAFTIDVTGPPRIALTPITLPMTWTNTGTPLVDGYNLVSNPVPSPIEFAKVNRGANVENYYWIFDPVSGNNATWNGTLGIGTLGANGILQSSQAFWLKANGPAVTTTVSESAKVAGNTGGFFGGLTDPLPMVRLTLQGSGTSGYKDEAVVVFQDGTPAHNTGDVPKLSWSSNGAPRLFTRSTDGVDMAIDLYGAFTTDISIPVVVQAPSTGTYTLTVSDMGGLGLTCLSLEDLVTGTITPLAEGVAYSFTMNASPNATTPRLLLRATAPSTQSVTPSLCAGVDNGTATVTLPGGPADVTWLDFNGNVLLQQPGMVGEATITGLGAGSYQVVVSHPVCGSVQGTFTIEEPTTITATIEALDASCPNTADGVLSVEVGGGTAPYSYLWSNGATQAAIMAGAGTYAVTVTDANGCSLSITELTITSGPGPEAAFTPDATLVTINMPVFFTNTSLGADGYLWDFGDGSTSTDPEPVHSWSTPGTYTVTLTAYGGDCQDSWTVDINVEIGTSVGTTDGPWMNAWSADGLLLIDHGLEGGTLHVEVLDAAGKLHRQWNLAATPGRITLPAEGLSAGIWHLRITHGGAQRTFRVPVLR